MQLGPYIIDSDAVLAPMAGVTDLPYRRICREAGAGLAVGEMVASEVCLRKTALSARRFTVDAAEALPVIQLLGSDPSEMAEATLYAIECGAKIVDINFGCPARMVCGKACGSALMADETLAQAILKAVAAVATVPVTVKMRTGWDAEHKNAVTIAKMAQDAGFAAVTVHGRTRADRFSGTVDRAAIRAVVDAIKIPVIANGDVHSAASACAMVRGTGCAAVMIGRGAYGNPWIFSSVRAALKNEAIPAAPTRQQAAQTVLAHFDAHICYAHATAGAQAGQEAVAWTELSAVRSFRKHARWYLERLASEEDGQRLREVLRDVMTQTDPGLVRAALAEYFMGGG